MKFTHTLEIEAKRAMDFQIALDMKVVDFEKLGIEQDDTLESLAVRFENGFICAIEVSSGRSNLWVNSIIYDPSGKVVYVGEHENELLGEYFMSYGEDKYVLQLVEKSD